MYKFISLASSLVLMVCVLGGCTSTPSQPIARVIPQQDVSATESLRLPAFSSITVKDGVDVSIVGAKSGQSVTLASKSKAIKGFTANVRGRTLYLFYPKNGDGYLHPRMRVKIRMANLRRLTVRGKANVTGRRLKSTGLFLDTHGNGTIDLEGIFNVKKITDTGRHNINIYWVNSKTLQVHSSGGGTIRLAGRADVLHTRLRNAARLDTKYLRTKAAYVRTRDRAQATILPVGVLHAFARDWSNIYYYKGPKLLDANGWNSGNPLHLHEWS